MFCSQCGKPIPDDTQSCPECQGESLKMDSARPAVAPANRVEVKSGLVQAILVTLFCCLPFGIVAIVYAARVSGLAAAGDLAGAQEAARKSNTWAWVSFGVGLAGNIIALLIHILAASR